MFRRNSDTFWVRRILQIRSLDPVSDLYKEYSVDPWGRNPSGTEVHVLSIRTHDSMSGVLLTHLLPPDPPVLPGSLPGQNGCRPSGPTPDSERNIVQGGSLRLQSTGVPRESFCLRRLPSLDFFLSKGRKERRRIVKNHDQSRTLGVNLKVFSLKSTKRFT